VFHFQTVCWVVAILLMGYYIGHLTACCLLLACAPLGQGLGAGGGGACISGWQRLEI
jgi:hypothetical protein